MYRVVVVKNDEAAITNYPFEESVDIHTYSPNIDSGLPILQH
jgi:hypothetical protein